MGRLLDDVAEFLASLKRDGPVIPTALAGISWGAKLAVITAGRRPDLVDALAMICPGLHPRVDVSRGERLRIALAYFLEPRKTFPIPLSDPALFTASHPGQEFIANDPLGLRAATASLLAASSFIDRVVKRMPRLVHQPSLLMLAGQDRIVDNAKTLAYFEKLATKRREVIEYPEGHHTFEFDTDPSQYARDLISWLNQALKPV
jgi:alpha-beta hydrolase superfamily lysophospholipase